MPLNLTEVRTQFPFLREKGIVYLDSAASAQKPEAVITAMDVFLREDFSNVHRGMYPRSERATKAYEDARETMQHFFGAAHSDEIVFTKNATEAINLVARSWGKSTLKKNDVVVLSILEHHSNIVPWLQLKEQIGIELQWVKIDEQGQWDMDHLKSILKTHRVKLVTVTGQSNVTGVRPPLKEIIEESHNTGALVCIDAAQLAAHHPIDVVQLDCDFLAITGHKIYGPTGVGVLYGKRKLLAAMPPFLGGGMMIREVKKSGFLPADAPEKFEAGTPPIVEAVGLAAAIHWLGQYSWNDIEEHESRLLKVAHETLEDISGLHILGHIEEKTNNQQLTTMNLSSGCLSFTIDGIHPHDLCDLLGEENICLRAGHHCAQPLHDHLGIAASARLSFGIYTTEEEVQMVGPAIVRAMKRLQGESNSRVTE
ncbi:MAG: cysteine desulfurase [Candidatus Peregrinibacteria bacterium]